MPSTAQDPQSTLDQLTQTLSAGGFPDKLRAQATRLRDALSKPRRVTLMGPAGSEQTHVLNLLAGDEVLPVGLSLGTVRVSHGAHERTRLTLSDGSSLVLKGLPSVSTMGGVKPVLTEVEAPLPSLAKISLMELADAGEPAAQAKALSWAAKQTDIAIWCTRDFQPAELALWQTMPDHIQDHAMVVCTDHRSLGGARADASAALRAVAQNSFAYHMALDPIAARRASAGEGVDKEMLRASGGMQLISSILKEIGQAQQDAVDQAEMLLVRAEGYERQNTGSKRLKAPGPKPSKASEGALDTGSEVDLDEVMAAAAESQSEPQTEPQTADASRTELPAQPVAEPEAPQPQAAAPAPEPVQAKSPAPAAQTSLMEPEIFPSFELPVAEAEADATEAPTDAPDAAPTGADPADPAPQPLPPEIAVAFQHGIAILEEVGLAHQKGGMPEEAALLSSCADALTRLEEKLLEASGAEHAALGQIERMTQDASDIVQLLRLEAGGKVGTDAGLEAVSVLLQLKRGLQAKVSA